MNSTYHCSICKDIYKGITLIIPKKKDHITYTTTYYNGIPNGITTLRNHITDTMIAEHWYDEGQLVASHLYNTSGEYVETALEYDGRGNVTQYWRYNSEGTIVDYEDYTDDCMLGSSITSLAISV